MSELTREQIEKWRTLWAIGSTPLEMDFPLLVALCDMVLSQSRWIPVGERLPEDDVWVLVHNGKWTGVGIHAPLRDDGYMDASAQWQDEHTEFIERLGPKVTHWMPLPPAPGTEQPNDLPVFYGKSAK